MGDLLGRLGVDQAACRGRGSAASGGQGSWHRAGHGAPRRREGIAAASGSVVRVGRASGHHGPLQEKRGAVAGNARMVPGHQPRQGRFCQQPTGKSREPKGSRDFLVGEDVTTSPKTYRIDLAARLVRRFASIVAVPLRLPPDVRAALYAPSGYGRREQPVARALGAREALQHQRARRVSARAGVD